MSTPKPPNPAKLVIGVILQDKDLLAPILDELAGAFGSLDAISPWFDFNYTHYYENEMGTHLFRRMMAFKSLIGQEDLAGIKIITNGMESHYLNGKNRRINLDPGVLLLERFVLATGKNFSHRIYIGKGIYADLTLLYERGKYQVLPWTYPDYAQPDIQGFLIQVREKYKQDLKKHAHSREADSGTTLFKGIHEEMDP